MIPNQFITKLLRIIASSYLLKMKVTMNKNRIVREIMAFVPVLDTTLEYNFTIISPWLNKLPKLFLTKDHHGRYPVTLLD